MIGRGLISWTRFINASSALLTRAIVLVLIVIGVAALGNLLWSRDAATVKTKRPAVVSRPLPPPPVDWRAVDRRVAVAMQVARERAEKAADEKLDAWTASLMVRVDRDFLTWYFGYWPQQWLGLKAIWYWSASKVLEDRPSVAERITGDVQEQFAARVLRPQIAQLELERITREVLEVYVAELSREMQKIPGEYKIAPADWQRYLEDVALLTTAVHADRSVPLTLKALTATGGAGTVLLVRKLSPAISRLGSGVTARMAGGAAGKLAAKTGGKVAARAGGKFAGPIIGIGVVVWDVWDHNHTKKVQRPVLRQSIVDYFGEVKQSLLHDPTSGILTSLHAVEGDLLKRVRETPQ